MKKVMAAAIVALVAAAGYAAYRRVGPATSRGAARPGATSGTRTSDSAARALEPPPADTPTNGNVLTLDLGARVEQVSGPVLQAPPALLDRPASGACWQAWILAASGAFPKELVFTFFAHQKVVISSMIVNPQCGAPADWARDVEVWASSDGTDRGFEKLASAQLAQEAKDQPIAFEPREVVALKLVIKSNHGGKEIVALGRVQAIEGSRPGYTPLVARYPELVRGATPASTPRPAAATAKAPPSPASAADACSPAVAAAAQAPVPSQVESRRVLVIASDTTQYPPLGYRPGTADEGSDLYGRTTFTVVRQQDARPALLLPAAGADTVVLAQVCDIGRKLDASFKKRLVEWVGEGHKLIIHDSDRCGGSAERPDYAFLPFRFATNNPGRQGASSNALWFMEENSLGSNRRGDPSYLDLDAWLAGRDGNRNELGDSNAIVEYDGNWCGHLFGRNQQAGGFLEAYAHYGRGLIIYNGFDVDQAEGKVYRHLVTRELAQGFDPDGLPCTSRLSDFVITTDTRLRSQTLVRSRTYQYPLSVLSNQGYKGQVTLSAATVPGDATIGVRIDPPTVDLADLAKTTLTVSTSPSTPVSVHKLAIRGTDTAGRSATLCLELNEQRTGGIQVVGAFPHPAKPNRNLLIVLDLSGSMNLPLERSTRIGVARQVLRAVLEKIPDDFNVGLRLYGHRYGSRQKETCTDSELVVPVARLERQRLLSVVDSTKPRGETPLVYSVLRGADDLKAAGGGSIVLITDGEESCGGDPRKAVEQLKASGIDLRLDIVGFTIGGRQVQRQLAAFAEGTGGHFYAAQGSDQLSGAILAAAIDKMQYTVLDATGRTVASGVSGEPPAEVPPGEYRVTIQVGASRLVAEHVKVDAGATATLQVVIEKGGLAIKR